MSRVGPPGRVARVVAAAGLVAAATVATVGVAQAQSGPPPGGGPPGGGPPPSGPPPEGQPPPGAPGPGGVDDENGPIRAGVVSVLVKISVLGDMGAFGDDPPWEIAEIDGEIQAADIINDTAALVALIDDRAQAAKLGLERFGHLTAEMGEALAPFTDDEIDILNADSDEVLDPGTYLAALEQLVSLKMVADGQAATPPAPTGTLVTRQLDVAFAGFDATKFLIGAGSAGPPGGGGAAVPPTQPAPQSGAQPASGASGAGASGATGGGGAASSVAVPASLPAPSGPPPLALVGVGSGLVLVVGAPLGVLAVRRRRRVASVGNFSARLVEVSKRLATTSDLEELRERAAVELRELVGASWARFVRVDGAGIIEELEQYEEEAASGVPSQGSARESALAQQAVADAVSLGATVRRGLGSADGSADATPAVMATPVRVDGAIVGVLVAVRSPTPQFTDSDSDAVEQFASVFVSALDTVGRLSSLESLAQADPLTSLGNRRAFDRDLAAALERSAERGEPLCLVMVDVDFFKAVNDRFGHGVGDRVLQAVASELAVSLRGKDLAYRYGGEEFCVLLHGASATIHDASNIAERLRMRIEAHDYTGIVADGSLAVTASFGLAITVGGEAEALQRRADEALYEAKRTGRNRLVVAGES